MARSLAEVSRRAAANPAASSLSVTLASFVGSIPMPRKAAGVAISGAPLDKASTALIDSPCPSIVGSKIQAASA